LKKYRSPNQTENILLATHERSSEILCNRARKQEDIIKIVLHAHLSTNNRKSEQNRQHHAFL